MKRLLIVGAGVGLLMAGGVAVAQAPNAGPPGGPPAPAMGQDGGPPREMGEMHRGMGWGGHMMHRPPPSKAARFMFRKGDSVVAIKCADDEPMKACVDAGSALLDKLGSMNK